MIPLGNLGIVLEKSLSNQISFFCGDGTKKDNKDAFCCAYTGRIPYDKNTHMCFVRNNEYIYVYINSKLIGSYNIEKVQGSNKITIGKSEFYYLNDLSQPVSFFKLYNNELNNTNINQLIHKDIFAYYFNDKCSKTLNVLNYYN